MLNGCTPEVEESDILLRKVSEKVIELQLPRLVQRHPSLCSSVLLYILKAKQEFERQLQSREVIEKSAKEDLEYEYMDESVVSKEDILALTDDIVEDLFEDLDGACASAPFLEQISPELLSQFGLQDGIWEHSGWTVIHTYLEGD